MSQAALKPKAWHWEFLALLAAGLGPRAAAQEVGVSHSRAYQVRDVDPEFAQAWGSAWAYAHPPRPPRLSRSEAGKMGGRISGRRQLEEYGPEYFQRLGALNREKHDAAHFRRIGQMGAAKRWGK